MTSRLSERHRPSSSSGLSPALHARIRLHLALIPAYIAFVAAWRDLLSRVPIGPKGGANLARDFAGVAYIAGRIANRHDAHMLFDADQRAALLRQLVPAMPAQVRYPPFYGPQLSILFGPLARLPYPEALAVWTGLSAVTYLLCGWIVWTTCPRLRDRGGAVLVLLLADPALYYVLSFAQISVIALTLVTLVWLALRVDRPFLAGMAVGALAYKPSLGVAAAAILPLAGAWPMVLGAAAGAALEYGGAALFWGPSILPEYVRALVRLSPQMGDEFYIHHLHSWRGFFEILRVPDPAAQVAYAVAAAVVIVLAVRVWRSGASAAVRFATLLVATVLVNPHGYAYDSVILMPAFLLVWDWIEARRSSTVCDPRTSRDRWLLYVCYWGPAFAIVAFTWHVQLSVPALTLLLASIAATVNHSRAQLREPVVQGVELQR